LRTVFFAAALAGLASVRADAAELPAAFFALFFADLPAVFFVADLRAWVAMRFSGRMGILRRRRVIAPRQFRITPDIQAG
jgi:hypothetical protein